MEDLQGDDSSGYLLPSVLPGGWRRFSWLHGEGAGECPHCLGQRMGKPCLVPEDPWAVLGDILVGGYLLEVNSTRGLRFSANEAKVIQGPAGFLLFPLLRSASVSRQASHRCRRGAWCGQEASPRQMAPQLFVPMGNFGCHRSAAPLWALCPPKPFPFGGLETTPQGRGGFMQGVVSEHSF